VDEICELHIGCTGSVPQTYTNASTATESYCDRKLLQQKVTAIESYCDRRFLRQKFSAAESYCDRTLLRQNVTATESYCDRKTARCRTGSIKFRSL
jgi:hypothetical protein